MQGFVTRLSFLLCLFLILSGEAKAQTFFAQSATLDNGLQIVVIPNHRVPVVTHMVWYKVGAADEPQGLSGMAHYFEHLMFKGTKTLAPGEFSRLVKALGGRDNAFTGQDYTAYFQTIAVQHLEQMMRMEADRMMNLDVPDEHFISEKKVVLEERRQRTENSPRDLFYEQMQAALFINHPYGTPVIGWMDEIEKYSWQDVKKFYDRWYAPNNAILILSGDITLEQALPMAQRTYGLVQPKTIPERLRPSVPPAMGRTLMTLTHPTINEPVFVQGFLAPNHTAGKDSLALEVLQEIISSGPASRLYRTLVVEQKKAISVDLSYEGSALDQGSLWLSAVPAQGVTLEEIERLIHAELADIIAHGVAAQDVADAILRLQDSAVFARDSVSGPAMIFGHALSTGATIEDIEHWTARIATITANDIQQVAKTYLDIRNPWHRAPVTGHLLPIDGRKNEIQNGEDGE